MVLTGRSATGLPQAAAGEPATHQDAHLRYAVRLARVPRFVDCPRPEQARPLLHLTSPQDGHIWGFHKRASWPCPHQHPPENIPREEELEGEDSPDPRQQPNCELKCRGNRCRNVRLTCLQVSPIQNSIYLISMAIIAGARTFHQVRATVKAGFWPVMKVSWIVSPISLAFAQKFLPEHTWVPFFNIVGFIIGTYINSHTKKKRLAALRRKHYGDSSGRSQAGIRPGDDPYDRRPGY